VSSSQQQPHSQQPRPGFRPSARLLAVLALLLILLAGVGWLAVRPGHRGGAASAQAGSPRPDEVSAVLQVLDRHAAALLHRDRAAWNADLDTAQAATDYRTAQQAAFEALAGVPLTVWRYTLVAPVTDGGVLQPAAVRLAGRVVVVHVQLHYAFARVDPLPTAKDEWLTAVSRGGGWRLAGDADADQSGGSSWHGPWDFGPLVTRTGPHTLVLAHPEHRAQLATFAAVVEAAIPVVRRVWGSDWNSEVAVLIPNSAAEFQAVTGDSADSSDLAAVAVADSLNPDLSVPGRDAVLGARIVLNPANLSRLDPAGRRLVVQHELTHIATRASTVDAMPDWLIEGFADYVGNLGDQRPAAKIAAELSTEVRAGRVPAQLPSSADFAGGNQRLAQVYEEAWLACRLIADRIGQHGLVSFYRAVAADARQDPAGAAQAALAAMLRTSLPAFTASWRAYLRSELGRA